MLRTRCALLAPITLGPALGELERDPGEGLGLVIVVTSTPAADAWRRTERIGDPTLTRVGVFTGPAADHRGRLTVDASTLGEFRADWLRLAGDRSLEGTRAPRHAILGTIPASSVPPTSADPEVTA